jgi:uncharacterized protein
MEFDWLDAPFDLTRIPPKEIEESFEDPFSVRLLPDAHGHEARYFNLGCSSGARGIFSVYWSNGKSYRVILSREMTPQETAFYEQSQTEEEL